MRIVQSCCGHQFAGVELLSRDAISYKSENIRPSGINKLAVLTLLVFTRVLAIVPITYPKS